MSSVETPRVTCGSAVAQEQQQQVSRSVAGAVQTAVPYMTAGAIITNIAVQETSGTNVYLLYLMNHVPMSPPASPPLSMKEEHPQRCNDPFPTPTSDVMATTACSRV